MRLNDFATTKLHPHLTILLDLSVEASRGRREQRSQITGQADDRMESESEAFHQRVRQSFLNQARNGIDDWLVLDATKSQEQLFQELLQALQVRKWVN